MHSGFQDPKTAKLSSKGLRKQTKAGLITGIDLKFFKSDSQLGKNTKGHTARGDRTENANHSANRRFEVIRMNLMS